MRESRGADRVAVGARVSEGPRLVALDIVGTTIQDRGIVPAALRASGVRIAFTTGREREIAEPLLRAASLLNAADALICGGDVETGRPAPFLIFRAMEATGVTSVHDVACAGDTPLDLQAGFNAGVRWNIGVLSGGQSREQLAAHPHTHILESAALLQTSWSAGAP
ncbi:MAG: HAD hydrolase-like protein [Acidobacteriota bacterium]|nr:HAD hydrolase-like protein [Acidobacteriota bacterium]